jgi:hypothetical protein
MEGERASYTIHVSLERGCFLKFPETPISMLESIRSLVCPDALTALPFNLSLPFPAKDLNLSVLHSLESIFRCLPVPQNVRRFLSDFSWQPPRGHTSGAQPLVRWPQAFTKELSITSVQ